ncbi:hypothetical protein PC128_g11398 [Phytophthora cactorum]|nr:hypothetical protein PC128_g11398 [Phytophthora cactorum]
MQITLQPPGIHTLSDGVIGSVVPRFWAAHDRLRNGQVQYIQRQTQLHSPNHPCADVDMKRITSDGPHLNSSKQTLMGSLHLQRSATRRSVYKRYELSECQGMKEKGGFAASLTSCDYNRRYRERKRKYEETLKNSKQQLEGQIIQLRRQRDQLTFQESRCLTVWTIATEYFRIFRRGILTQDDIHPTDFDFLHAAITPDVLKDATCGVDGLFTQWFPDIHIQLKEFKTITKHSLVAFSTTSFTISAAAMQGAFPHLFQAEEGSRCAQIAARLRDQHLVLQSSVRFDWDEESKQLIRLQSQADMVPVLVQKLGINLEDVALMFNFALITPECHIRKI